MTESIYSPVLQKVRQIVADYSRLPDAIVRAQCKGMGRDFETVASADLGVLAERIGQALSMFTNPAKGQEARDRILSLR